MFPSLFLLLIDIACCLQCETISKAWVMSDEWVMTTQNTEHRLQNAGNLSWDLQTAKESKIKLEWVVLQKKCFFEDWEFSVLQWFSFLWRSTQEIQEEEEEDLGKGREFIHVHIYLAGWLLYFVCLIFVWKATWYDAPDPEQGNKFNFFVF